MKYAIVHIADIHLKKDEPEGACSIMSLFMQDLKNQKKQYSDHEFLLAITGDIVYSGVDIESYTYFYQTYNKELDDIGILNTNRILVPGNHDVDQSMIHNASKRKRAQFLEHSNTEQSFNNFICNDTNHLAKFDNYLLFESDFAEYGVFKDPLGCGWLLNSEIGFYCLNTAICSFGGLNNIKDDNNLAICTRNLVAWCNQVNVPFSVLMMHHPLQYLNSWSCNELKHIIDTNFTLCLCGHKHNQDIYYNKISNKCLVCSAPQLFSTKSELLGYAIIMVADSTVTKIVYRQYNKGQFVNGVGFSENDDGVVHIPSNYRRHLELLDVDLKNALAFFKGQPNVFVRPKLSKNREFNDEPNLLDNIIANPFDSIIVAQPQFGLTCLAHYMKLEAYKIGAIWIYLDAKTTKARQISNKIREQLNIFETSNVSIKCFVVDSWDSNVIDHRNILKQICDEYQDTPIILLSNYAELYYASDFSFQQLNRQFDLIHLQALERNKVRDLVVQYNFRLPLGNEDSLVTRVVKDLEALNVHRTPLNCLTLLKVFERDLNQDLLNRTNMIKTVLFVLFTDADSFTYASNKPDVNDCEYILGKFCKSLIEKRYGRFSESELKRELNSYCKEKYLSVNVDIIVDILKSNNILLRIGNNYEFRHSYWIYYFAATYMMHDSDFETYILRDQNYVSFPEIIEFYTGLDGKRRAAVVTLLDDLRSLLAKVQEKIGIYTEYNPLENTIWNPSKDMIDEIRKEICAEVKESKLPVNIKDQHADQVYNSEAPYDQSINRFLNEYSVISLVGAVKASSRALRNSNYVEPKLRMEMLHAILEGWERISKIIFWLSPVLAKENRAVYEGFGLILVGDFQGTLEDKLKAIYLANPTNIINLLTTVRLLAE